MDKEPQLPPRPTNSSIQDSKNAFITWGRLTSVEAELWNYVPPAPKDGDTDRSNNHQQQSSTEDQFDDNHRNNILYDFRKSSCRLSENDPPILQRPSHLFKTKKLSASSEQLSHSSSNRTRHFIDWHSSIDQNGNRNEDVDNEISKSYKEKIMELFKISPNHNERSNSLTVNTIPNPNDFNFQLNPLYSNCNVRCNNSNNHDQNEYAKLYWPLSRTVTHPSSFSSSLPGVSPLSPIANPFYMNMPPHSQNPHHLMMSSSNQNLQMFPPEQIMNLQLIDKINSTKIQDSSNKQISKSSSFSNEILIPDVLTPISVYPTTPENPKQIIDLFDPLAEKIPLIPNALQVHSAPEYVNNVCSDLINSSTKREDIINNNNSNVDSSSTKKSQVSKPDRNSFDENKAHSIFESFKVEPRETSFSKELKEFCEHLKSLYMTCFTSKTTSSCDVNSGLVFSPQIEVDDFHRQSNCQSDKLYFYGISNANDSLPSVDLNQITVENNNDDNLIIIDVRFNSLVYYKITNKIPNESNVVPCVKVIDPNYLWFSMKFPADYDKTVDVIISHVVHNVAEKEKDDIDDFLLKLNGFNEFLQSESTLSSYVYVQNCKINNIDIVLELVDQTATDFWRPFLRCESDTKKLMSDFNYQQILPKQFVNNFQGFNHEQLNNLIDDLNCSYTTFISAFMDSVENKKLFHEVMEKISTLKRFLSNMETSDLILAIEKLESNFREIMNYTRGDSVHNNSFIEESRKKLQDEFLNIVQIFVKYIELYSNTFPVNFGLPKVVNKVQKAMSFDDDQTEKKFVTLRRRRRTEISQLIESLTIHLDSCTQVPDKWSSMYHNYAIMVNIFHGYNLIKSTITNRTKIQHVTTRFKRLTFNQCIDSDIQISMLPRECRIELILAGFRAKSEVDALATTFLYLFDIDEIFQNGFHLLPWTELKSPYTFPPISMDFDSPDKSAILREFLENNYLVSHNLDPDAMMIVIRVTPTLSTNIDYYFPEIKTKELSLNMNSVIPMVENDGSYPGDSLYGFHGCNTNRLTNNVIKILQKNPIEQLTNNERDIIWKQRKTLREFPGSILKLMKSPSSWSCHDLPAIYELLKGFDQGHYGNVFRTKIEVLQLLSMDYPDKFVRRTVVKWLNSISVDELCDYLPQLVQSLRFETSIDCHLIWSLFEFSLMSARFCHYFYWQLKSCLSDNTFGIRCQIYLNALLSLCGERTRDQFLGQDKICEEFSRISAEIKQASKDSRTVILRTRLEKINEDLKSNPTSLPLSPALFVNGLAIDQCSYFNSNSLPLKLVFDGAPPYRINSCFDNYSTHAITTLAESSTQSKLATIYKSKHWWHKIIFKCGDDLRKDMLVMQIISIINRVWLRSGLNLRLIIFNVLNSSHHTGMIEMVSRASTLREIQQEHGLTGNFKHHTIATWLKRYNTNEFHYKVAIENFIHSCAGYVVITYLLGICDRHNDNIMVTTSGNLFHIDFGKFFGDAQMMAGIKRDRVPFVFTADMAFVINEGGRPSKNYQFFVDLCCRCFILVRQNGDFLLSLMAMMIRSGIDYVTPEAIQYFHKALMPNLIESQAKVEFNKLIEKALGSLSTQLNFFLHSIAQSLSSSGNNNGGTSSLDDRHSSYLGPLSSETLMNDSTNNLVKISEMDDLSNMEDNISDSCQFSFTKCRFTESLDGHITQLEIVNFKFFIAEKNDKINFYKIKVDRLNYPENFVYRSFKEFLELYEKLSRTFPLAKFYTLKRSPMLNRASRQQIASHRTRELTLFLKDLMNMASEISHSDFVYTFFHPILRDQQFSDLESINFSNNLATASTVPDYQSQIILRRQPKIKLNLAYRDDALHVLVCHVRNLDNDRVTPPDSYVKLYLRPDQNKITKRKTRTMPKNAHPTFMETFAYKYQLDFIISKTLEVSVWESDMTGNKRLGQVEIPLSQIDLYTKNERWYNLQ